MVDTGRQRGSPRKITGVSWLVVYLLGVAVGLWRVDGAWATRLGVALAWPLGIAAFGVTIAMLVAVAAVAFPMFGIALALAVASAIFLL